MTTPSRPVISTQPATRGGSRDMPVLPNHRHELFAQGLAQGKSATEAYGLAGYKEDRTAASRLSSNVNVQRRLAELLERAAVRTEITIATLTEMYLEDRKLAQAAGQYSVSKGAADSLGKLHGLIIERKETGPAGAFDRMNDDELDVFISERAGGIGVGSSREGQAGGKAGVRGKSSRVH